jgi:hypothetical protein
LLACGSGAARRRLQVSITTREKTRRPDEGAELISALFYFASADYQILSHRRGLPMSVETFQPIPIDVFGTWMTLLDPSDVPPGMSPDLRDVEFFPGRICTRPGLLSAYTPLGGAPKVNGLRSYITKNLV